MVYLDEEGEGFHCGTPEDGEIEDEKDNFGEDSEKRDELEESHKDIQG